MRRVRCECGTRVYVDEGSLGRPIRCRCGRTLVVRRRPRSLTSKARALVRTLPARLDAALRAARKPGRRRAQTPAARAVAALAWAYLAGAIGVAVVMRAWGDAWWPATTLLFSGRWIFLLPLVPLVPGAAIVRRARPLGVLLLAGLIVLGPVMGFHSGWRRLLPNGSEVPPLRLVTFNADGGDSIAPRLALLLADWRADVVTLQECGERLQTAVRAQPGWYHHEVAQLCTLSRYPLGSAAAMDRSALAALRASGEIGGAGYVVRYVVQGPTGPFGLVNLHLETPRKGFEALMRGDTRTMNANTELRDLESDLARRWADGALAPAVIAGDFNTPAESRIFARHWGDLDDAFDRVGFGFGATKYNGWIRVRIDHVLTGSGWRAVSARVGGAAGSDHRPLMVELERRVDSR